MVKNNLFNILDKTNTIVITAGERQAIKIGYAYDFMRTVEQK